MIPCPAESSKMKDGTLETSLGIAMQPAAPPSHAGLGYFHLSSLLSHHPQDSRRRTGIVRTVPSSHEVVPFG